MNQRIKTVPVLLIFAAAFCAGGLYFYQLLRLCNSHTGMLEKGFTTIYVLYALIFAVILLSVRYAFKRKRTQESVYLKETSLPVSYACALASAGLLYDFVHQCFNCYRYFDNKGYIDYAYIIPTVLSGIFALLCASFFIALFLTARGTGVDFRRILFLSFAPVVWCAMRIFTKMNNMFDFVKGVEPLLELALLISLLIYFAVFISESESSNPASVSFIFQSLITAFLAFLVSVPRLLVMLLAGYKTLYPVDFSCSAYLFIGVFIITLLYDNRKREKTALNGE